MLDDIPSKAKDIFKGNALTQQDTQEHYCINKLTKLAFAPSKMMVEIQNFLIDEYGHRATTIFFIFDVIVDNKQLQKALGNRILTAILFPQLENGFIGLRKLLPNQMKSSQEMREIMVKLQSIPLENPDIYRLLLTLKQRYQIIDVLLLQRLIKHNYKFQQLIKQKDLICVMGSTGSGKTTNILRMLGYNLKQGYVKGLKTLIPQQSLLKEHESFLTSPEACSCTKYMNATPIPDKMYRFGIRQNKKNFVICDSPGFGDTSGIQVDISNGIGMIDSLSKASSIRIVIVLEYQAIIKDKSKGIIDVGNIISGLISNLKDNKSSILILFNKVPMEYIQTLPLLFRNKIQNLNPLEATNDQLKQFLVMAAESADNSNNFLNPLNGDYKKIVQKMTSLPPLYQIAQKLNYQFQDSTKKQIIYFAQQYRNRVIQYFQRKEFEQSAYFLRMLEKLKKILDSHQKLEASLQKCIQFIENYSSKLFISYEQNLKFIQKTECTETIMEETKTILIQSEKLEKWFINIDDIKIIPKQMFDQSYRKCRERVLLNIQGVKGQNVKQSILSVSIFSKIFGDQIVKSSINKLVEIIQAIFINTNNLLKDNRFRQSSELFFKITTIIQFIIFFEPSHAIIDSFKKIKEKLMKFLYKYKQSITNILIQPIINENDCAQIQNCFEKIKQIQALKMVDSQQQNQRFEQCQKLIMSSFNEIKKKLEKHSYSLHKSEGQQSLIQMNFQEQIISKIVTLENLSNLKPFTEQYKIQCKQVKQTVILRLKSNHQILKQNFSRLKIINLQQKTALFHRIKVECSKVLQCIQSIEGKDISQMFSSIIGNLFVEYCSEELLRIEKIKALTLQIQQQNLKKIELQYILMKNYSELGFLSEKSQKIVTEIHEKLLIILKAPLYLFIDVELKQLQLKQNYKHLLEKKFKMQKIFHYITSIKHFFTQDDYKQIFELQTNISNILLPLFKNAKKDIKHFIELQSIHEQADYLKDLLKFLCELSSIDKIKIFLANSNILEFQLDVEINSILKSVNQIQKKIEKDFDDLDHSQNNFQALVGLLKTCKFYYNTEQFIVKTCKKQLQTNFQELSIKINKRFIEDIKKMEQKIHFLTNDKLYSQICWEQLQQINMKISKYSKNQSKSLKTLLIKQLKSIQIFYQKSLRKISFEYEGRNNEFPKNQDKQRIQKNILTIQESIQLYWRLRKLFTDEDNQTITILIQIQNQVKKMLQFYDTLFQKAKSIILSYSFLIKKRIPLQFQNLSAKIWDSIALKEEIQLQTRSKFVQQFKESTKQKKRILILSINSLDSQHIDDSSEQMEKNSIKYYLQELQRIIEKQIYRKYQCDPNQIIFDKDLSIYYSILSKSGKQLQQKKQNLTKNISVYVQNHLSNIRNASRISLQQTQTLIQSYNNVINVLPQQLKRQYNESLKIIQKSILEQKQKKYSYITKEIYSQYSSIDTIIPIVQQIFKKKQTLFHKQIVQHIQILLTKKINNHTKIIDKLKIINIYCIQGVKNNNAYFSNDQFMFQMLDNIFIREIQNLFGTVKKSFLKIGKYFENYTEIKSNTVVIKDIIKEIFSIVPILMKQSNQKEHLKEQFQSFTIFKIIQTIEIYQNQLKKRPILSLFSLQIMNDRISSKLQRYIQYIRASIDIWEAFKTQILQLQSFFPEQLQYRISQNISDSKIIINNFQEQSKMNIELIEAIDFQNQSNKSLTFEDTYYQIEKVDFILGIYKFKEKIINTTILCGRNVINAEGMINGFVKKIEQLKNECLHDLQQLQKDYCHETSYKVNLLLMILNCTKQKKLKILTKQRFQHLSSQIDRFITNRLGTALKNCHSNYESCKIKVNQYRNQITALQYQRQYDYQKILQQLNIQFQKKVQQYQQKFQQKCKNEKDSNRLQCYQRSKYTQISILSNQFQLKIQEKNKDVQSHYSCRLYQLYQEQAKQIINFSDNLLKILKFIHDVDYKREKYQKQLLSLFIKLKNSGQHFVKLLEQYLSNNHKDIYKIGRIIISNITTPQILNHSRIPNIPPQNCSYSDSILYHSISSRQQLVSQPFDSNNPIIMTAPSINVFVVRALIGIDGSSLNQKSIAQISQILKKSLEYSYKVFSFAGIRASIQMKIIVYKDYDCQAQHIAWKTDYETNPHLLIDFLQRMPVQDTNVIRTTAVQVFLYCANMQQNVDQILIISQKSPNTRQDIINKRAKYGENYWNSKGLPKIDLQNEVNQFLSKKCPIHNLYMGSQKGYQIISQQTNGYYFPYNHFSIDSSIIFYVQTLLQQTMKKSNCAMNLLEIFQQMMI